MVEIIEKVNILNKEFPTSYDERLEYTKKYFQYKMGTKTLNNKITSYIKGMVKNKPVTVSISDFNDNRTVANAHKTDNVIQLSKNLLDGKVTIGSGYKREEKYIERNVTTYNDYINWVVAHEYAHLLFPYIGHTNQFFQEVERLYKVIN